MATRVVYVEYFYPGLIVDNTSELEVGHRDPEKLEIPDSAFGFRFFDRMKTIEDGVEMVSEKLNVSPMQYYGGRIMTLVEVLREMPDADILISNMANNGYYRVIKTRSGTFKPFLGEDIYIPLKQE